VIPIQTLAREGFVRKQRNLVRELRKLLKRGIKLALAERLRSGRNLRRLFKQACGIRADVNAMLGGLAAQFRLNLGLDVNDESSSASPFPLLPCVRQSAAGHQSQSGQDVSPPARPMPSGACRSPAALNIVDLNYMPSMMSFYYDARSLSATTCSR